MNLLSGGYVTEKGGSYYGKGNRLTVHGPDDRLLLTGEKVDGLYLVDCHMVPTDVDAPTAYANAVMPAELMHRRMGHVGMANLKLAARAVTGMEKVNWGESSSCQVCPLAKQTEESFPRSESCAQRPMELVHTDVMGPFPAAGMHDEMYTVTLMDDYSRYAEVICLKNKSQVAAAVIERLVEWERQCGHSLKMLRSDHGTEYKAALNRC